MRKFIKFLGGSQIWIFGIDFFPYKCQPSPDSTVLNFYFLFHIIYVASSEEHDGTTIRKAS